MDLNTPSLSKQPIAIHFDGRGKSAPLAPEKYAKGKASAFNWYYLNKDEADTEKTLKTLGLDSFVIDALMAEDTRPRFTGHDKGAILILRGVNLNEGAEPTDMVSLRFWIEKNLIVGIWVRRAFAVRDVMEAIDRGIVPISPSDMICKIAFRLADRAEPIIAELSEKMDDLEDLGDASAYSLAQKGLVDIRQSASILRRFMVPQRDALTTFSLEEFSWLKQVEQSKLREAAERITRLGEELDSVRERAMIAHDQILAERSDKMNRTMLILTVMSAIFLPLGLLTGLLGVNVGGIPGASNPMAFWMVSAGLVMIGVFVWWLIKRSNLMD